VGKVDKNIIDWLKKDISEYISLPVGGMDNMAIPDASFDLIRNQCYSTKILKEIIKEIPCDAEKILAVIDKDIFIPILTFVFGEAQLDGIAAIVSLTRLRQEYYHLRPDTNVLYERLHKESLHELGHTFGLVHCSSIDCAMYLSNTVRDIDRKGKVFCNDCTLALSSK